MLERANEAISPALQAVLDLIDQRNDDQERTQLARFVRDTFAGVDAEDLADRRGDDLYGAALGLWNLARKRAPGGSPGTGNTKPQLRVFNPALAEHGWHSTHTVVQIVNDDMPFLVDSVSMEVNRHGLMLHLTVHPIVSVCRDANGVLTDYLGAIDGAQNESWMHVEVDRISEPAQLLVLQQDLQRVLADVRAAVDDWPSMMAKLREVVAETESTFAHPATHAAVARESVQSALEYLAWLAQNHFTFVGYRCHELATVDGADSLRLIPGSGLGVLRESDRDREEGRVVKLPDHLARHARKPELLILTKSNQRSTIHRPGYLDYVGIKRFDEAGRVCGEHRFLGLYTSKAYGAPVAEVPLVKQKVARVMDAARLPAGSHAAKALAHVLDTYPRDELLQIDPDELLGTALGILHLGERQRFRLFVRLDPYERFIVCLIFVPRESYSTEVRRKWQKILSETLNGEASEFDVSLSESAVARVMITVRTKPGVAPTLDAPALEARLEQAARRWEDELKEALSEALGEARGNALHRQFALGFPAAYREDFSARASVADIEMLECVHAGAPLGMTLYRPVDALPGQLRFKLAVTGGPVALSDGLPMLERMGVRVIDERPYRIATQAGGQLWLHDFGLSIGSDAAIGIEALRPVFEQGFAAVFAGQVENDDFNRLVVRAGMPVEDIVILRAYARYFRQIGFALSPSFIEATLAQHGALAGLLVRLFQSRFDPARTDDVVTAKVRSEIEAALDQVENLNEDRVLRQYVACILASTRTNYFRRDANGAPRSFVSIKIDPAKVPGMPEPRPMFEIFVYSPRFEGVHLRGGKVARGGLRWSDRPEDFRTEVLGLMKAQMVKNTVIVPVGSKGGFVLKKSPPATDRDAYMKEGVACYQDFLRGLLDVTDNLVAGSLVPPAQVRRHDADDPYLVVAADKGTATFSDYANAIAQEYRFWLDDAFASGGSVGYDHKVMAITSRGAWESVQRHFRELGHDIRAVPFTVVGIGDMSGDVFGNGMLRSEQIKLVAVADHRHIFIDPAPDPARSFQERKRLFALPRSSWADYDKQTISAGGGVWPRTAKTIRLSREARQALAIDAETLTPNELVSAMLRAPVDLLFNGGIGTFVKSSEESHAEVGDRANDAVRVDGKDLRCKIVGEGGNLGFTQRGRVEYAMRGAGGKGGRINTDAIDNSAGVETSDHEVNIKILLGLVVAEGELTEKQRNALLREMTEDVAKLVLRDNTFQNQSLSLTRRIAPELLDGHARFIQFLEKAGRLNRAIEFLPSDEEIAERRLKKQGLTVPELSVLLAYSKIWLYDELLSSTLPDDPWVATALVRYFPKLLGDRYAAYMPRHPLAREIIATHVTNSMINRVGSIFVHRLMETTGARPTDIVRAYLIAREVYGYVSLWQAVEALDWQVSEDALAELVLEASRHPPATSWFLRSKRLAESMAETIATFRAGVDALDLALPGLLDDDDRAQRDAAIARYTAAGVPQALAARVASLRYLGAALDLVEVAAETGQSFDRAAGVYFQVARRMALGWMVERIGALPADTHWQYQAKNAFRDDLAVVQRSLTAKVLTSTIGEESAENSCARWFESNRAIMERTVRVLEELRTVRSPDASMISVGLRELRALA